MAQPKTKLTHEQITEKLREANLQEVEWHVSIWQQVKCRLFGPHDWLPLYKLEDGALIELGRLCDICHKEVRG